VANVKENVQILLVVAAKCHLHEIKMFEPKVQLGQSLTSGPPSPFQHLRLRLVCLLLHLCWEAVWPLQYFTFVATSFSTLLFVCQLHFYLPMSNFFSALFRRFLVKLNLICILVISVNSTCSVHILYTQQCFGSGLEYGSGFRR
jgi:hypothetical protein